MAAGQHRPTAGFKSRELGGLRRQGRCDLLVRWRLTGLCSGACKHMATKRGPACSAVAELRSAVSPIPRLMVPDITVSTSDAGCVCGAIAYPAGNLSRRANRPALVGSPNKTAASAPAGSAFAAGPHLTSLGAIAVCTSSAEAKEAI